ncbi:T6SS immunity protein Tli4 family protein [Yersinia intermedia]|uniref:T6SS immunity protein Tli4 family protein n=1 Tax=Yersinia intermedia TaxID=631 RepID=UPI001F531312|nr:T6SS immunity protein Tli4 family protein [Yersinia intermedia]UNK25475.1 T6SS immunity protein Tli4 family protein [Yersinia intermedia]
MKKFPLPLLIPLAMLLLAAGFYIHNYVTFVHTPPALTNKEKRMVDTLFTTTKAQCVGRYVFEVPASFENTLTDRAQINEVSISSKRLYRPAFEQRIRLREETLKNSSTVDPIDQPFLKQVYRVSENAVIFDRNKNESEGGVSRILEGHLYVDGVAFILTQEILDLSEPKYQKDKEDFIKAGVSVSSLNTKPSKLAELQDLMSRLSGRKNDDIPTQPGTCISEGFIRDGSAKPKEDITFVYPHNSVFSLSVSTNTYLGDPKSMLERSHEIQPYLTGINARTLRKDKTQIAGFEADEWLNTAPSEKSPGHPSGQLLFNAIANEKIVDFRHPIIDLTLSNYALPPPAYSDAELVEIWDRITRSFRLRNNVF